MASLGGFIVEPDATPVHEPVLVDEVLEHLASDLSQLTGWVVDATLGAGGHASRVLERAPGVQLLGIDQDEEVLSLADRRLMPFGDRARLRCARMSELEDVLADEAIGEPVAMLMDLGANSYHFDQAERGFSFQVDGPLDMRMDTNRTRTAADIVNRWDEQDLADLIYYEGGERSARRIARAIVENRRRAPFLRTAALAQLISENRSGATGRLHPATKTFQALRRAVNEEGDELLAGLATADAHMADGGRLAIISFHEGEDRAAKHFFRDGAREGTWETLTPKPITPGPEEIRRNRRARSSRLRVAARTRPDRQPRLEGLG